ncbi:FtsX-like permease family protein [Chitinophaga agrisoli]|uniref:FtsX-like permease family protein n=1 Tax=Chitinophaga agrisoli TaxID=2607653 RepID=A0A5B2VGD1_9BACT|nr:ABC transporter permease [Chitinophaga agrisoli]KAA2238613.1 FtsX-like permease family protein [Chitinophaga agrisoli]
MIKNYCSIAWRSLLKHKFYTAVNIGGLSLGLAVGILIILWVQNELSYDRFHRDTRNIYRVLSNMGSGSDRQIWANSHAPLATYAKKDIPEVKNAVRIRGNFDFTLFEYKDKQFTGEKKGYVDPSFFTVFDYKLLKGSRETPFGGDHSVILTASAAKRYFNNDDPLGKILQADNKENFVVTGVLADFPENSSISYDMLFPMSLYAGKARNMDEDWGSFDYNTFLQLTPGTSPGIITPKLARMLRDHYKDIGIQDPYSLQPLADMHLYKTDGSEGQMQTVRIFLIVGILILVIACINYVNLSTARALVRAKEVSVRKMIGAGKSQLFTQFIVETALVFVIATVIALLLVWLLIPLFNEIAGKNIRPALQSVQIYIIVAGTLLATLTLSSIYPALLLSSFEPLKALKGKLSAGLTTVFFRKALVTAQFVVSAALITGALIFDRQLAYMHQKELGYDKEYVFTFGMRDMQPHAAAIKAELQQQLGIRGVSFAGDKIVNIGVTTGKTDWDGKGPDRRFLIHPLAIDKDFMTVFKLQLTAGKGFTGVASDSGHYILNETAVKETGITDPIGKRFKLWDKEGTIIGVVRDFHFASLKQKIEPAVFQYQPESAEIYVKTTGKDAPTAIAAAAKLWERYNGGFPFQYSFLDETYDDLYRSEQRTGLLFDTFSIVAILISCLGLFGLAAYTAQVKTKEIGVRKVMGASVAAIIRLLVRDFIQLVILAILIAGPLTWYAAQQWLQGYAYRIPLQWWMFAVAGLLSVTVALLTVSAQSIKAALMSPVKSLASE